MEVFKVPLPNAKMKIKRDGVTFESNVDAVKYTLAELTRAALRDTANFLRKRMIEKLKQLPGMKRSKRIYNSTQYWVRKQETDLQIGFKHGTWYGEFQELGDRNQPRRDILRGTVLENIDEIQKIQSQYLSSLSEEQPSLESEEEYISEGEVE